MNIRFFRSSGLLLIALLGTFTIATAAQTYDFKKEFKGMSMEWKVDSKMLHVRLVAETKGWVGVGFNPKTGMKGANFILGYVKRGKVKIIDEFGVRNTDHINDELNGGTTNVSNIEGSEKRKETTISFSIPFNSNDASDTVIDPNGKTLVLLAFGPDRDNFHTRHKFRTKFTVILSTGKE